MDIRNGKYLTEEGEMSAEFFTMVKDYEDRLHAAYQQSELPKHVDNEKVGQLLVQIYENFVL